MTAFWKKATLSRALIAMMIAAAPLRAGTPTGGHPEITGVRLHTDGAALFCDVTSSGLLGENITGTVRSGLPAVVELFFRVRTKGKNVSIEGLHTWSLEYDVWDDRYTVSSGDSSIVIGSIDAMRGFMENLRRITLVPLARLAGVKSVSAKLCIVVSPLSGSQSSRLSGWVDESVRSGRDESWREQVLNVNDLISHFFSREGSGADRSEWFETGWIKPSDISASAGEDR